MKEGPDIARIAALIGDPARANILTALMSGQALTVSELAEASGVTIQTASSHLAKLHEGGLLRPRKQGRHKYFSLSSENVAHVVEGLMGLATSSGHVRFRTGPKDNALREARLCYNHLAGRMGIAMFDSLVARNYLVATVDELNLTPSGEAFAASLGIDVQALRELRSPLCLECLDWSERRSHLAGVLGRAFLKRFEAIAWAKVERPNRVVSFSRTGVRKFAEYFPT